MLLAYFNITLNNKYTINSTNESPFLLLLYILYNITVVEDVKPNRTNTLVVGACDVWNFKSLRPNMNELEFKEVVNIYRFVDRK